MIKSISRILILSAVSLFMVSCGQDAGSGNTVDSSWANEIKKGVAPSENSASAKQVADNTTTELAEQKAAEEAEKKAQAEAEAEKKKLEEDKAAQEAADKKAKAAAEAKAKKKAAAEKKKRAERKKRPKMSFDQTTFNYGMIMQGDEINHKFRFVNTGKSELVITNATASCGCTQPSYPFIPIAPGEEGFIGVNFNSTGKLGPQKPTITITTNASPKTYKLYLDGFVDAERAKDQGTKKENEAGEGSDTEAGTEE